ncbi:MAG: hypothetical protein DIU78_013905 [Pseudomonadota bacterium]|nr:MAG: hypothetical protein DIU78_02000 [Pseudomonadota bacterium]
MTHAPSGVARPAPRPWPALRAALLTFVLAVQCVAATPAQPIAPERFARAENQRLVGWLRAALAAIGISIERPRLEQTLIDASEDLIALRSQLLEPVAPFFRYTDTRQQWGLFLLGSRQCFRLHIQGRNRDGGWELLYRAGAEDRLGLAPWLRYRRLRGIFNPNQRGARAQYRGFVDWVSRRILAENIEYDAIRVSMERLEIGEPGEPTRSLGFEHVEVRTRAELVP